MKLDLTTALQIPDLDDYLTQIDTVVISAINNHNPVLYKSLLPLTASAGKRLRASLLLAASKQGKITDKTIAAGTSIELLHLSSLIHDDILDDARTRRGIPTINYATGIGTAILAGDYLFAVATAQAATTSMTVVELLASAFAKMCEGQAEEKQALGNAAHAISDYYDGITKKTGALMAASCTVGAVVSGRSKPDIAALTSFGRNFGIAFQLIDDMLDFLSTEELSGKPIGGDLSGGVYTLPLLLTLHTLDPKAQQQLLNKPVATVAKQLLSNGSIDTTIQEIQRYNQAAKQAVHKTSPTLSSFPDVYFQWALQTQLAKPYRQRLSV